MVKSVKIVLSKRVVLENGIVSAAVVVSDGVISEIITGKDLDRIVKDEKVLDLGDAVVLPGLVDSHVHVNEPGRTEWEGFWTATQAAAAGGVTTIVDMPLNSIPPTTTVANFQAKVKAAEGQLHVDTAFWCGLIPSNHSSLIPLVKAGVVGFKCFLCPSGVDEFPNVDENDVRKALALLQGTDSLLAFHAELDSACSKGSSSEPEDYQTFLETRPAEMETSAVELVCKLCAEYKVRCHIVHASSSDVVVQAKRTRDSGAPLTIETCHHYLTLASEDVPKGATIFKCCPPIRDQANQDALWSHVLKGDIPLIVSDHSPCPPDLKGSGDFLTAWGGISSLQFGLSVIWTCGAPRGISLLAISRLLSTGPAQLCRLSKKGSITVGKDADLVVFDPDEEFVLAEEDVFHRHKMSPHLGRKLRGRVLMTILRGQVIYRRCEPFSKPKGKIILVR